MNIDEARQGIDTIDDQIAVLYARRMQLVDEIGRAKEAQGIAVQNTAREKAVLNRVTAEQPDGIKLFTKQVFETMFSTAKAYQLQRSTVNAEIKNRIIAEVMNGGKQPFPVSATVACQGVEGANSQTAAEKLFALSNITFMKDFEGVFNAVDKGLCQFGVLPIENSSVGSVNAVYDLMKKHDCYIVRSVKLRIRHCLLAKAGVNLKDIKEVFSHEQALAQCSEYLKTLKGVKVTVCDNTAVAARTIAESGRRDAACIASHDCAGIYGLSVVAADVQDNNDNYTRFIAISKQLRIYQDSNKISLMVNLLHAAGSLNRMLDRFSALGLNLTKLESRPTGSSPFEFTFYFDFDARIERPEVLNLIAELSLSCERFVFLGSYQEVV